MRKTCTGECDLSLLVLQKEYEEKRSPAHGSRVLWGGYYVTFYYYVRRKILTYVVVGVRSVYGDICTSTSHEPHNTCIARSALY